MTKRGLVLLGVVVILAACGGDDDAETTSTTTLAAPTEPRPEAITTNNGAVVAMNPETGEDVRTIAETGDLANYTDMPFDVDVDWLRDNVYFTTSSDCLYNLLRVPLAGGEPEMVAELAGFARVSPSARYVAWIQDDAVDDDSCFGTNTVVIRDLDTGEDMRWDGATRVEWAAAEKLLVDTGNSVATLSLKDLTDATHVVDGALVGATLRFDGAFGAVRRPCPDDAMDLQCPSVVDVVDIATGEAVRSFGPFAEQHIVDVAFPAAGDPATADLLVTVEGGSQGQSVARLEGSELVPLLPDGGAVAW